MELVGTLFWFNPFFHLTKKEIKTVHEFLADQYAAAETDKYDYAELLAWQSYNQKKINLINPFFHNQIKRRIAMITQLKNSRFGYISRLMALPLMFFLFCAFGLKLKNMKANSLPTNNPITVIIDPGHGGNFEGGQGIDGASEKELNLAISKEIQKLSKEYNVNVILTRDKDEAVGNASTLKEDLENRVRYTETNKADAFISIHVNSDIKAPSPKNGFEIYVSKSNINYQKSIALGSSLTDAIKNSYTIAPELKERDREVMVLKDSKTPAVMVECGYITNKEDLAFISNPRNQEKIARDILEGVVKFASNNVGTNNLSSQGSAITNPDGSLEKSLLHYLMHSLTYPETNLGRNIAAKINTKITIDKEGHFAGIDFNTTMPDKQSPKEIVVSALAPKSTQNNSANSNKINPSTSDITIFENSIKNSLANFKYEGALSEPKSIYLDIVYNIEQNNLIGVQSENMSIERTSGPNSEPVTTSEPYTTNDTVPTNFEQTFTKVEIEAEYPGGQAGWSKYLINNLKYPEDAIKRKVQGTVLTQFIVNIDGSVSDIKILESPNQSLSEVAYNAILHSGNWIPAMQNGKKVKSFKKQPFVFKLDK